MRPATASTTQVALAGLVERVTFHNAENGFWALRTKARGHRDLVTVVGQKKAAAVAVRNVSGRRRWSKLSERLNRERSSVGVLLSCV
jgi:hypothetical protein